MMRVFDTSRHPVLYCSAGITINWTSNTCSTLFLLNMTFDRFYSIMRPHKADSFNTARRAKITVEICVSLSILYNSPHIFINSFQFGQCVPYGSIMRWLVGRIYYWLSYAINFVIPFVLLSTMNSFIISTIRKSRQFTATASTNQGHGHDLDEGHGDKTKQFEKQT